MFEVDSAYKQSIVEHELPSAALPRITGRPQDVGRNGGLSKSRARANRVVGEEEGHGRPLGRLTGSCLGQRWRGQPWCLPPAGGALCLVRQRCARYEQLLEQLQQLIGIDGLAQEMQMLVAIGSWIDPAGVAADQDRLEVGPKNVPRTEAMTCLPVSPSPRR